jgi:hypothetical protein
MLRFQHIEVVGQIGVGQPVHRIVPIGIFGQPVSGGHFFVPPSMARIINEQIIFRSNHIAHLVEGAYDVCLGGIAKEGDVLAFEIVLLVDQGGKPGGICHRLIQVIDFGIVIFLHCNNQGIIPGT